MASLSELIDYAHAKQPRNGLAEVAAHFIEGASQGYDSGLKARADSYDHILKSAQAIKAQEEARTLKIQNDMWQSFLQDQKLHENLPMTAGEDMTGRIVTQKDMGTPPPPVTGMAKIATMFTPPEGMTPNKMVVKLPGQMGGITYSTPGAEKPSKPRSYKPDNPLNKEKEDRIVWEKATNRALEMAQAENPLATFEDAKKYLPTAFRSLGKDPKDYIKAEPMAPPPANNDPWGLLGNTGQ